MNRSLAPPLRIVAVGDATQEFESASEFVQSIRPAEHKNVLQLSSLVRSLESGLASYDLIVVFQNRPDEFDRGEVDRLISVASLSRIVCIYSSWCESDGRTRDVWPYSVRVPADRAKKRLQQEVAVLHAECEPLPITASRDETFRFDFARKARNSETSAKQSVFVISPDGSYRRTLTALLANSFEYTQDFATVTDARDFVESQQSTAIILLDTDPLADSVQRQIALLKEFSSDCNLFAICNYPRIQDRSRFAELGFAGVLPKLVSADELLSSLQVA